MTADPPPTQFHHSIKVPIQYKTAAKILKAHIEDQASLKDLVYKEKHAWQNPLLGLLSRIPKHKNDLDRLVAECQLKEKEPRLDIYMGMVMMTELLFGSGRLTGHSKPVEVIRKYEAQFREVLAGNRWLVKAVDGETLQKNPVQEFKKPRYVRVNTNLFSRAEAIEHFTKDGYFEKSIADCQTYDAYLQAVRELADTEYVSDMHVNNLFVFPASSSRFWALHALVTEHKLILQDKASCLPAMLLNPPRGSTVLDMCAAPGMKTTHLAAMLKKKGTVYAVEKDLKRYKSLCRNVQQSGSAAVVHTLNEDTIQLSAPAVPGVQYILVDPSCSGSGMTSQLFKAKKEELTERLARLSGYQLIILKHALTNFPDAQKVVYSTCSVYEEENEQVVHQALQECPDWELVKPLEFADKWKNFGSPKWKHVGKQCFYARTEVDLTDGFFVAVLQRKGNNEWKNGAKATTTTTPTAAVQEETIEERVVEPATKVKKAKKSKPAQVEAVPVPVQEETSTKKKSKKRPVEESATAEPVEEPATEVKVKKSKKSKTTEVVSAPVPEVVAPSTSTKKKSKKRPVDETAAPEPAEAATEVKAKKTKKSKKANE